MPATLWIIISLFFLSGCYKGHLYVQQEWIDRNFLASSRIGTPDPRQENFSSGQRLLIDWRFPNFLFDQKLFLVVTVRLFDHSEKVVIYPVEERKSYTTLFFPNQKILTYRVQVANEDGCVLEQWEHHFWTELIDL